MPYLNWKEYSEFFSIQKNPPEGAPHQLGTLNRAGEASDQLVLKLRQGQMDDLTSQLEEVFLKNGHELRIGLSDQWLLFWKWRSQDNRVLLAHPNSEEWVGTLALQPEIGKKLIFSLKNLISGESLKLSQITELHPVSNMDLVIQLQTEDPGQEALRLKQTGPTHDF